MTAPDLSAPPDRETLVRTLADTTRQLEVATREIANRDALLRAIIDTETNGLKVLSRDGRILDINTAGLRIVEAATPEAAANLPALPLVVAEHREAVRQLVERVFDGESGAIQFEIVGLRGGRRWLDMSLSPRRDGNGAIIAALAISRDLTSRRQVEAAGAASDRMLRMVMDNIPQGVFWKDRQSRYLGINRVVADAFGFSDPQAIVGKTDHDLPGLSREQADFFVAKDREVMDRDTSELGIVEPATRQDGRSIWMETNRIPMHDAAGHVVGVLGTWQDITERKWAEEQIRATNALLEGVTRLQREFLVEADPRQSFERVLTFLLESTRSEGGFIGEIQRQPGGGAHLAAHAIANLAWNDDVRTYYEAMSLDGRDPATLAPPAGHPPLTAFLGVPLVHGDERIGLIGLANRPGGYDAETEQRLSPIAATCASLVLAFRLERQRRRAEAEQHALQLQLQHSQKLESLGILAGGIAHDFNNLLTSILGYADLALIEIPGTSQAHTLVAEVMNGARRAAELARQMLAYSGKGRFVVEPLDLSALTADMTRLLQISISKKCVLKFQLMPDLPSVEADTAQMRQIIMNLLINASEAIGDRSGVIAISTGVMHCDRAYLAETYFDEQLTAGLYVYLEVADTGAGMSAETRARIFDPFFTTKFTGRGLGLSAVLGIVRGHRGAIKCYSEIDRGTTFKVLFPATGGPAAGLEAPPLDDRTWRGTGLVLVVDDEESARGLAGRMMERMGFEVRMVADGREAVEVFRAVGDRIRLVLLDMTMPHLDGEETFRELRRLRGDIQVILMSGYNEQTATSRFAGKRLAAFIQKPYRFRELMATVRQVLHA